MSAAPRPDSPDALRRELEAKSALVQDVRKELILAQVSLLELNDTILQKETEKADAVSLLGQFEHALEEKVNHIVELDRVLNERIRAAEAALASAQAAHERITQDLVQKLDVANREIGRAHELAAGFARELAGARDELQRTAAALAETRRTLEGTEAARATLALELAATQASWSWRMTRPFRALRRMFP
jgi:chromosome segregation ATPase